jgi:hypothetical protein
MNEKPELQPGWAYLQVGGAWALAVTDEKAVKTAKYKKLEPDTGRHVFVDADRRMWAQGNPPWE